MRMQRLLVERLLYPGLSIVASACVNTRSDLI